MKHLITSWFCVLLGLGYMQCCDDNQFECGNGKCIPARYVCGMENDCGDNSDEPPNIDPELCESCPLPEIQFRCDNGYCITKFLDCDMENDCFDGSDERQNCPTCPEDFFECKLGGCVPKQSVCDGKQNCYDWSDESVDNCPCGNSDIRCVIPEEPPGLITPPGACIPPELICDADGIWDCPDGRDERNCTSSNRKQDDLRH